MSSEKKERPTARPPFETEDALRIYCKNMIGNQMFPYGNIQKNIADYFEYKTVSVFAKVDEAARGLKKWKPLPECFSGNCITEMMIGIEPGVWCFASSMTGKQFYINETAFTVRAVKEENSKRTEYRLRRLS